MKYSILLIFFILGASELKAETTIQLHTVSYHVNREANFNEENYGLGFRHYMGDRSFDYFTAGFYENSERNQSNYAGVGWEWPLGDFKVGINAGLITGYELGNVLPYAVPIIKYKNLSLVFAPYPEAVTHLIIDITTF